MADAEYTAYSIAENEKERAWVSEALRERGLEFLPSQTNFILIKMPRPGQTVVDAMLREGVIIRAMDGYSLPQHVRVTVGTREQNERFLGALDSVLTSL